MIDRQLWYAGRQAVTQAGRQAGMFGTRLQGDSSLDPADEVEMKSCGVVRAVPKICYYEARTIAHVDIILISS